VAGTSPAKFNPDNPRCQNDVFGDWDFSVLALTCYRSEIHASGFVNRSPFCSTTSPSGSSARIGGDSLLGAHEKTFSSGARYGPGAHGRGAGLHRAAVEKRARRSGVEGEELRLLRVQASQPVLMLHGYLLTIRDQVLPKSEAGQAVSYALNNWVALTRYCDDGDLSIDNNHTDRSLRRIAVGRNNWTFVGSDRGGRRHPANWSKWARSRSFTTSSPESDRTRSTASTNCCRSLGSGLLSILLDRSYSDEDLIPLMMFS